MGVESKGFSIIVATLNSEDRIADTIKCIGKLKTLPEFSFELLIINNNSVDGTETVSIRVCEELLLDTDRWQVLKQTEEGKTKAIELGVKHSKFEYLIICDDDNLLDQDYLLHAFNILEKKSEVGALGGACTPKFLSSPPKWFYKYQQSFAVGTIPGIDENGGYVYHIWGAGTVIRKKIYDDIITKKINFLTGKLGHTAYMTGEDHELCLFVRQLGWEIFFSPELHFIHAIPESRLTWEYFRSLTVRNSIPEIYLSIYPFVESCLSQNKQPNAYIFLLSQIKEILPHFLSNLIKKLTGLVLNKSHGYAFDAALNYNFYQLKEVWYLRSDIEEKVETVKETLKLLKQSTKG